MKVIFLFTVFFLALSAAAQTPSTKSEAIPPRIIIMPDLYRTQLDSVIQHLKQLNIELTFERLEYDPTTKMIAIASGKVINKNFPSRCEMSFNSDNFKGLTIRATKEKCEILVGLDSSEKN